MGEITPVNEAKIAVLDLIEHTAKMEKFIPALSGWLGHRFNKEAAVDDIAANHLLINQLLARIGGLDTILPATDTDPASAITLSRWKGTDPSNPEVHKWLGFHGSQGAELTFDATKIAEMRKELQAAQNSDV